MTMTGRLVLLSSAALSLAAFAEDKVEVMVEVVHAKKDGNQVDPGLEAMKATLKSQSTAKADLSYGSLKRVSSEKLQVGKQPAQIKLPNKKTASVKLVEIKDGSAHVSVSPPAPGKEVVYSMGKAGTNYLMVGAHDGGDLWILLSKPGEDAKPRRAEPLVHPASPVERR